MAEITLKSGKVVNIDVTTVTVKQWREFSEPSSSAEKQNTFITACTGLTTPEIDDLPYIELKRILKEIIIAVQNPLSDPN